MQPFAPNASELSLRVPFFKARKTVPNGQLCRDGEDG